MKIKLKKIDPGELCRLAFKLYEENTDELKREILTNFLKYTYETIPKDQRCYVLGDMDVHDGPIRDIIYGENNIANWDYKQYVVDGGELFLPSFDKLHQRIKIAKKSGKTGPASYIRDEKVFIEAVKLAQQSTKLTITLLIKHFGVEYPRAVEIAKELKMSGIIDYEVKYDKT